ncbi:hypothetical protein TRIATDRAFT_260131 [Trichoderma atroviride IMI 206040]|uniref:Uncharacterized protein n=1 Tax=Hypocrea atroviridis (strain ATCC 20476 / IMI 206040) TaxID=452589 RepID=G9P9Z5_HYPAI|nr:uncharacterized protein TRIATDRAFT_302800 [Trichoderma atroviride IMI 206040]EHK40466.1 hypothetical protein TRIATDRAFT_260131 [Trichoderma atroviride IMI 206040]
MVIFCSRKTGILHLIPAGNTIFFFSETNWPLSDFCIHRSFFRRKIPVFLSKVNTIVETPLTNSTLTHQIGKSSHIFFVEYRFHRHSILGTHSTHFYLGIQHDRKTFYSLIYKPLGNFGRITNSFILDPPSNTKTSTGNFWGDQKAKRDITNQLSPGLLNHRELSRHRLSAQASTLGT